MKHTVGQEALKQAIDQPLHFIMMAGPIWLSEWIFGMPWPGLGLMVIIASVREYLQWPSSRWWDPWLDWSFYVIGIVVATWIAPI